MPNTDSPRHPLGYEQLTGISSAKALTGQSGARLAIISVEGAAVRWRDDGTNPTTTVGMRLADGGGFIYASDPTALKFIEETGTAKVNVSYYA